MIVKTDGIVTRIKNSLSGIVYLTVFTPLGRLSCYATGLRKKPFLKLDRVKYSEVKLKLYSNSSFQEDLVKFPCEIVDLEKTAEFTEERIRRKVFRYACYLVNNFSVVRSGERFYYLLKVLHEFLRNHEVELKESDAEKLLVWAELFTLAVEGLIGGPELCPHVDLSFKKSVFYVINKNSIECFDCAANGLGKELLYVKSLNSESAKYFYKLLSMTEKEINSDSLLTAVEALRKGDNGIIFQEVLSLWDVCFTYHFLNYIHEIKGRSFFRMRKKFYKTTSEPILKRVLESKTSKEIYRETAIGQK